MYKIFFILLALVSASLTYCQQSNQDFVNGQLDARDLLINEASYPDMWHTLVKDKRSTMGSQKYIDQFNDAIKAIKPKTVYALQPGSNAYVKEKLNFSQALTALERIIFKTAEFGNLTKSGKMIADLEGIAKRSGILSPDDIKLIHNAAESWAKS